MSVVKINAIQVPSGAGPELERRFAARAGMVDQAPGFLGFQLLRPVAGEDRYFVVTQWVDDAAYEAWRDGSARAAHSGAHSGAHGGEHGGEHGSGHSAPVATGANLLEFEVVLDVPPAGR